MFHLSVLYLIMLVVVYFRSFVLLLNEKDGKERSEGGGWQDEVHPSVAKSRYLRHSEVAGGQVVEPQHQPIAQDPL